MTTNKKGASAGAPQGTSVHLNSVQSSTTDFLTVLTSVGPVLTKHFMAEGRVDSYDSAKNFKPQEVQVKDIHELHRVLTKLEKKPHCCVIRGKLGANPELGDYEGTVLRNNETFDDCEHHWISLDIDKFKPFAADPVTEPVEAIREFLETNGLTQFLDCSFHWQLSSSAGMKPGILKAHVWFWLETPWLSSQLYAWAKGLRSQCIDSTFFRRVQIHYTANPIFDEGVPDPVAVRSGFYQGARDTVPFAYDPSMVDAAAARVAGGSSTQLKDPSAKDNLIGAYHRAFEVETVLMEHLEGMFEPGSTERRWTWLDGGGTPEGAWVHDDRMHVGASHHTWPFDGVVNLWDLVRVLKFGHLDKVEGDDFEAFDMENRPPHEMPSHKAMVAWVETLPEVQAEIKAEDITGWLTRLRSTCNRKQLNDVTEQMRKSFPIMSEVDRELAAKEVQQQLKRHEGQTPPIAAVRKMLAPVKAPLAERQVPKTSIPLQPGAPAWLSDWCYVTATNMFYNYSSGVSINKAAFEAMYDRCMHPWADEKGRIPSSADTALTRWNLHYVHKDVYLPDAQALFNFNGHDCVNTFRPGSLPVAAEVLSPGDLEAIALIKRHILRLCNWRNDVADHVIDWVAHNAQFPGRKIRHSLLIQGFEGCGKSTIGELLSIVLGDANIKKIGPVTINGSDFTGWAEGGCVGILEEVRLAGHNRYDVLNKLKPLITDSAIGVHPKGIDPYTVPNTMNYIAFTNFKDALPLNDTDRRWMPIFAPWADLEELTADLGEDAGGYFAKLYAALHNHGPGLRRWLLDRDLVFFDRHAKAPHTEEKNTAIAMGVSEDLDTAKLLIEAGAVGVSQNVVSTALLRKAFQHAGIDPPGTSRMRSLMADLGFRPFTGNSNATKTVKWRGESHRVWTKARIESEEAIRKLLDATEVAQVNSGFSD